MWKSLHTFRHLLLIRNRLMKPGRRNRKQSKTNLKDENPTIKTQPKQHETKPGKGAPSVNRYTALAKTCVHL